MTREGDLLAGIMVGGVDSYVADPRDVALAAEAVTRAVGALGEEFGIYLHALTLPMTVALQPVAVGGFADAVDACWQEHLRRQSPQRRVLMLTIALRPVLGAGIPIFGRMARTRFEASIADRMTRLDEAISNLTAALGDLKPRRLLVSSGEWLGLLGTVQGQAFGNIVVGRDQYVAVTMTNLNARFRGKTFELDRADGRRFGAIFAVKGYPPKTWAEMLDGLRGLKDLVITSSFTPGRQNAMEARIKLAARQMRASEDAAESLRQGLIQAADDVASGRAVFGRHHLTVMVTAASEAELEEATSQIWRVGQGAGMTLVRESFGARAAYFAQAPGNWSYRARTALISAANFADFAALHASVLGRGAGESPWHVPVTAFQDGDGSLYTFNFHERWSGGQEPSAGHTLILGTPGTGKTLLAAFLMAQARRADARIFVFDKDCGLEMAVRALGGRYSAVRRGQPTGLKPVMTETDARGRAWLDEWLRVNLARERPLDTLQGVALSEAVARVAEAPAALRNFDSFRELVAATDDRGDLMARIGEWGTSGRWGWLFAATPELMSLDADVTGIDMTEVLDTAVERGAFLTYVFRRIERVIEDRRPTLLIIDEAWKALDDELFVKRLHDWLVTMRKKNCVVMMLTQSPSHLASSRIGPIIVEMSTTQVIFPNPRATPSSYDVLHLSEKEAAIASASTAGKRAVLLRSGGDTTILNVNMAALGPLMPVLGGGRSGEEVVGSDWRNRADFWKRAL
ncbi:MAG: type IV secretion system DNA-binding domain-containing protein [Paracoccaceae bacterium]|nr:type IV secretion system DNA-binding domain-containing protein [Paracoccaceae bacterium]